MSRLIPRVSCQREKSRRLYQYCYLSLRTPAALMILIKYRVRLLYQNQSACRLLWYRVLLSLREINLSISPSPVFRSSFCDSTEVVLLLLSFSRGSFWLLPYVCMFCLSLYAHQSIDPGQQFTWEHSNLEVNKPKNRYANVIAYDHSRVILAPIEGKAQPHAPHIFATSDLSSYCCCLISART